MNMMKKMSNVGHQVDGSTTGSSAKKNEEETRAKERAKLEESLQKRLALEKKAHGIVEELLDNPVTSDFLIDCVDSIMPQHYQDVVTERSIIKHCGYPLCQRSLGNIPKQKYHISIKTNKVYDITDRKCFCSQFCYKASKFYEAQLSDSPLWTREMDEPLDITILTRDMEADSTAAGLIAKDNLVLTERLEPQDVEEAGRDKKDKPLKEESAGLLEDDLSNLTFAETRKQERLQEPSDARLSSDASHELQRVGQRDHEAVKEERSSEAADQSLTESLSCGDDRGLSNSEEKAEKKGCIQERDSESAKPGREEVGKEDKSSGAADQPLPELLSCGDDRGLSSSEEKAEKKVCIQEKDSDSTKPGRTEVVDQHCERNLSGLDSQEAHISLDATGKPSATSQFDHVQPGGTKLKAKKKSKTSRTEAVSILERVNRIVKEWTTDATVEFIFGCQQPPSLQQSLISPTTGSNLESPTSLPTSDPAAATEPLAAPAKPLPELKQLREETEEYSLRVQELYYRRHLEVKMKKKQADDGNEENDADRAVRLPLVDSKSQMGIRRKIVSDRLNRVYSDFLAPLGLSMRDISSDLQALIRTFQLSSTNITLKPAGWTMLSFLLLHILARRNSAIRNALEEEASKRFLNSLLVKMGSSTDQLTDAVRRLEPPPGPGSPT